LGTTNLLERYRAFKLGLHIHFRLTCGQVVESCAFFQWRGGIEDQIQIRHLSMREDHATVIADNQANGDHSMLVGIIDVVEHPQGILISGSPSMVWLHPLKDCLAGRGRSLYHGSRSGFIFLTSLKNGELPLSIGRLIVCQNELINQVVEGGAELISDFTSEQSKLDRWLSETNILGKESNHSFIEVSLNTNSIRARFKLPRIRLEPIEVLHGSFNLGPDFV
jgi:hypothetical protein